MKHQKLISTLTILLLAHYVVKSQTIFTPNGGINGATTNGSSVSIGFNSTENCFGPLEIMSSDLDHNNNYAPFTTMGWGRNIILRPVEQNHTSTIIWEKGDCDHCENNFFIGGPTIVPQGDYMVGLAKDLCGDNDPDYITHYYGVSNGSGFTTVPQGATQFLHNLLVNGPDERTHPRFAVGTLYPRQAAHINNGSLLLTGFGNDGNIYFSDQNDDTHDTYNGNWGVQYYGPGMLGQNDPGGLNFWTPSGSQAGFANNRLYLSNRNGNIGINTFDPKNQLEITSDVNDPSLSGLRFTNLTSGSSTTASNGKVLSVNSTGDVILVPDGGLTSSCTSVNMVPKVTSSLGALGCSQIYDNGTSVGINTTSPRTFSTSGTYDLVSGSPANSTVARLDVNGLTFTNSLVVSSDKRFKKNITPVKDALNKVSQLNGVTYNWNTSEFKGRNFDDMPQIGFVAQDVAKIIPEAVMIDDKGYYAMNYNMIIPVLTEAIKEQQQQMDEMHRMIDQLEKGLSECCSNYQSSEKTSSNPGNEMNEKASLEQNIPNPFSETTIIRFYIPQHSQSSVIKVYSLDGKELKSFSVKTKGAGQVEISKNSLTAGTYVYHLIIDGKNIDSKLMTLTY